MSNTLNINFAQIKHPNEQSLKISAQSDQRFPRNACARAARARGALAQIVPRYGPFYKKTLKTLIISQKNEHTFIFSQK